LKIGMTKVPILALKTRYHLPHFLCKYSIDF
jgi:hypothetical protein